MSFTATSLKNVVLAYAARTDITDYHLAAFAAFVESEMNIAFDGSPNLDAFNDSIQSTSGTIVLPADFHEGRFVIYHASGGDQILNQTSLAVVLAARGSGNTTLTSYARVGNKLILDTASDQEPFSLYYTTSIGSLFDLGTNWVLTEYPQVYTSGVLAYLFDFAMDEERATYWRTKFNDYLEAARKHEASLCYTGSALKTASVIKEF